MFCACFLNHWLPNLEASNPVFSESERNSCRDAWDMQKHSLPVTRRSPRGQENKNRCVRLNCSHSELVAFTPCAHLDQSPQRNSEGVTVPFYLRTLSPHGFPQTPTERGIKPLGLSDPRSQFSAKALFLGKFSTITQN